MNCWLELTIIYVALAHDAMNQTDKMTKRIFPTNSNLSNSRSGEGSYSGTNCSRKSRSQATFDVQYSSAPDKRNRKSMKWANPHIILLTNVLHFIHFCLYTRCLYTFVFIQQKHVTFWVLYIFYAFTFYTSWGYIPTLNSAQRESYVNCIGFFFSQAPFLELGSA